MHAPARSLSYPLSPSQTRKLLGDALATNGGAHPVRQLVCEDAGLFDEGAFRRAWETIVDRHTALGAAFRRDENQEPYQQLPVVGVFPIDIEKCAHVDGPSRQAFLEQWLEKDRRRSFDLATRPVMRLNALRFAENRAAWIWSFHPILLDSASLTFVVEDFFAAYEAIRAGGRPVLPERAHFSSYAFWYRDWLAANGKRAHAYWQNVFAGDEADAVLSIARPTSATGSVRLELQPSAVTIAAVPRLAAQLGVSLETIMQGAWALLLSRYYRSQSVTFATVRPCRENSVAGADRMIGPLANFLPVHVRIDGEQTVRDFLHGIATEQNAAREFQGTPWEILRGAIPVAAGKQLFDSSVICESSHEAAVLDARFGANGTRKFTIREDSDAPLLLLVADDPRLALTLVYQAGLFEAAEMLQLTRSLLAVLDHLAASPDATIGSVELLDIFDRHAVDRALAGPVVSYDTEKGLHQWFEAQAQRTPDEIAITAQLELTYEELDSRATNLARRLVALGVAADQLVVVFFDRSAAALIAILGVLKSGAAYLPLDVALPRARLQGLLEDSKATVLLTERKESEKLPVHSARVLLLDELEGDAPACELPQVRGSQLAYVIPTSGTTGRPKLIGVEHRQASNLLTFATQSLLEAGDVKCVPFIASPSFDSSISQIFTTLSLGGTLVLVADILSIRNSPAYPRFTCLGSTPSLLATILRETGLPPAVQFIGLGAEAIPADLLEKLHALSQVRKVINYYGPTETTVYCSVAVPLDRAADDGIDLRFRGRIIGRPIANTRLYLADEFGHRVPPGAPGEIFIAGAGVSRGYLNHSGAGAKFGAEHFVSGSNERLYPSGDLGCLRADGQIEFLGRKDHQVKFNGVRIETAEIENALLTHPGVRQALVDLRADGEGRKRLVAYLVVDGEHFERPKLREALRLLLPGSMIPQHYLVLESLPLTTSGKVDREALARFELGIEGVSVSGLSPGEERMTAIFERNLGRKPIGPDQDYFELGGDSLSSVNLLLAIEQEFGVRLKPRVLLDGAAVADLALAVEKSLGTAPAIEPVVPASFIALQKSGKGTALILCPGGSGEGFLSYKTFAKCFGPEHPVYALQSPYTQMLADPATTVGSVATHFAREAVLLADGRPFVLFGHCVGGLLAWHIASAIAKMNAPEFKLVLFDAPVAHNGANVTLDAVQSARRSRWKRVTHAYQLAWADWRKRHGNGLGARVGFMAWAANNISMRKGWSKSDAGRDSFARLAYLRALQGCPLGVYPLDLMLIYNHVQASMVSKSLWQAHAAGRLRFEFVNGSHGDWESGILNTTTLVLRQLEALEGWK